jgi:hypothetical protein
MQWIAPEHTTTPALSEFRRRFHESAVGLVMIDDFLSPQVAEALHTFLSSKAEFEEKFGTYESGDVAETEWRARPETDRMFYLQSVRAPLPGCELDAETLLFLRFRHSIEAGVLNGWFADATGITFDGTTTPHAHRYQHRHFLREHTDNALNRKVAVIVYLGGGFSSASGGFLALRKDERVVERVMPEFNRAVLFDVTRNDHFIEPFDASASSVQRLSIGWWLV